MNNPFVKVFTFILIGFILSGSIAILENHIRSKNIDSPNNHTYIQTDQTLKTDPPGPLPPRPPGGGDDLI